MSLTAALGYVIAILIFALFMRRYRKRMIKKYMEKAAAERKQAEKGSQQ